MSEFNGTKLRVWTQSTPGKVDFETDLDLKFNRSSTPFRNKDSGNWRELLPGAGELASDLDFNFHVDISAAANNNIEALWDDWLSGVNVPVEIASETTGELKWSGPYQIQDLNISAADQNVVEGSCTMMSAGVIAKGTVS